MIHHFIEATNGVNWGKFAIIRYEPDDYAYKSHVDTERSLLRSVGWSNRAIWVMDLQTGEGAKLVPGGSASADLQKHKVWVCPMYEPFLEWLYRQDLTDITKLPAVVHLTEKETAHHTALFGYRRKGEPDVQEG